MRIIFIAGLIITTIASHAQRVETSTGSAQIKQENNVTTDQVKKEVLNLAKVNAIENAFGSYVEQDVRMHMVGDKTYFNVLGGTKVKGEWIQTIGSPKIRYEMREVKSDTGVEPEIWWICEVKGKIREVTKAKVDFVAHTLRKPDFDTRTDRFNNEEDFYFYFQSAESGHLSVYIESEGTAYRLLPYAKMSGKYLNSVPVAADQAYIYFDPESNGNYYPDFNDADVDEMTLFTEQALEVNQLYVVFSTDPFTKPILSDIEESEGHIMPKSLSMDALNDWLEKNSAASVNFAYKRLVFEIVK